MRKKLGLIQVNEPKCNDYLVLTEYGEEEKKECICAMAKFEKWAHAKLRNSSINTNQTHIEINNMKIHFFAWMMQTSEKLQ